MRAVARGRPCRRQPTLTPCEARLGLCDIRSILSRSVHALPLRAGLGVVVALLGVAIAGCGAARQFSHAVGRHPAGARAEAPPSSGRIEILTPLDDADLAVERTLPVRLELPWDGVAHLTVAVGPGLGGSRRTVAVSQLRLSGRGPVTTDIPVRDGWAATVSRCRRIAISVTAVDPVDRRRAALVEPISAQPPVCGRFFSSRAAWNTPLAADAPLDPDSAAITRTLVSEVRRLELERFYPNINTTAYSVPIYTVGVSQRRVPVILDDSQSYADGLRHILRAGVPIPSGARAAPGSDEHMVVWQPGTKTMWELWHAHRVGKTWHAGFGGVIHDEPASDGAYFSDTGIQLGATGSGLALAGGLMTLREISRGAIDHALAFAVPQTRRSVWALPASRSDGTSTSPASIPEGARFRLPASLNIASLHLAPLVAMMARAVKRYGMIVRDQSGTVSFYGQQPIPGGLDPYPRVLGHKDNPLARFPWKDLELVAMRLRTWGNRPVSDGR